MSHLWVATMIFSKGTIWPDSMVTKVHLYDTSDYYDGKSPEYFILKESEQ